MLAGLRSGKLDGGGADRNPSAFPQKKKKKKKTEQKQNTDLKVDNVVELAGGREAPQSGWHGNTAVHHTHRTPSTDTDMVRAHARATRANPGCSR